ncbi:Retrovirus-related Pol polyprotein from type-1 retrotransposable element R2 [Armadillidium vulgare]|nr:Retrovirus-related Pol polyprotein from type-1 retrotransposable element R2 [Armadillidium vulgare]
MSDALMTALEKKGYNALLEPTIPTEAGIQRPDLVVWKTNAEWVIDTTVTSDDYGANINIVYQRKCSYCNTPDIKRWVTSKTV